VTEIFQSKTAGIIKKVPRSHVILLQILESLFREGGLNQVEQDKLLVEYNRQAAEMMIERIKLKDLDDMLETLANSSVISRVVK